MSEIEQRKLKDVIIPVAGLGSRMFPLTLSIPKNLLPVGNKTLIQYAVEEALLCGAEPERIHIICSPAHLEMYKNQFRATAEIEELLKQPGKELLRQRVESVTDVWDRLNFIIQEEPLGLGHAVLQAKGFIEGDFGVILPDDLILQGLEPTALRDMLLAHDGGMSLAAMYVSDEDVSKYGNFKLAEKFDAHVAKHCVVGIIEKPKLEDAQSNLAVIGRYILQKEIVDVLTQTQKGAGGEIQLTDAIEEMRQSGMPLYATTYKGTRFDCGDLNGYAHAQHAVSGRMLGLH